MQSKMRERERGKRAGAWCSCSHHQPDTQTNFSSKLRFAYAVSQSIEIQFLVFSVCPFICYCVVPRERCCCSVGCCRSLCTSKTETTGKGIVLFTCNLWLWAYVLSHSFHFGFDCIRSYRRYTFIFFSLDSISFAFSTEQHRERSTILFRRICWSAFRFITVSFNPASLLISTHCLAIRFISRVCVCLCLRLI